MSTRPTTIARLLVANRGEIARRVFATCRRLGIETVAVYSDADAGLPFVAEADTAVRLPGSSPADTYLRGDLVIEAARRAEADAIHPGYGFLSESGDFARDVLAAGLVWIGPDPLSIDSMGSKIEAKRLMASAGVPVLADLGSSANEDDLPLLVKASAGGGGRGMRVVRSLADLPAEVAGASAEAESAFGDGAVFVEPYVEHGRHIEVQVVGDRHGVVEVFGERDCSIQRRHQKVVEEAPAPRLPGRAREALHDAARAAAAAIGYVGAGTVEFLVDGATPTRFWFLEMNTRLQVEHPVTEAVFGVDLVEAQITVAEGGHAPKPVSANPDGHAVEVRLYAEDPADAWHPQSGTLKTLEIPGVRAEFCNAEGYGIRLDAGFVGGNEVGTHYDAMLAKVISWAPTREAALRQLSAALAKAKLHGLTTNRDLLVNVLRHSEFVTGDFTTAFLDTHEVADRGSRGRADVASAAAAATIALAERDRADRVVQHAVPVAWRNVVGQPQVTRFVVDGVEETVEVSWRGGRSGYTLENCSVVGVDADRVVLDTEGLVSGFDVVVEEVSKAALHPGRIVHVDSAQAHTRLVEQPRLARPPEQVAAGSLLAPMPGAVVEVMVTRGDEVVAGQPVLALEAMKMHHSVTAPHNGVVEELHVRVGSQVSASQVLAIVRHENGESYE